MRTDPHNDTCIADVPEPNINTQNSRGDTVLHTILTGHQNLDVLNAALGRKEVDVNLKNVDGSSPLLAALDGGIINADAIKVLVGHEGIDINLPNTEGLCTPGVTVTEDTQVDITEQDLGTEIVTTTTTTVTTTTETITNQNSDNILDGSNGYVNSSKEGDMDIDWGGQGPANMPSGGNCYALGTDKCAQITGSGNSTSSMGVSGMGTTFINTVDISSLDIENGGRTNYTIKVDKRDAQDRVYMHITGRNGKTNVFSGTDILSESGVTSGFQEYSGGFDFSGTITTLIIEVGGRDINLAIGPLFDDVTVNVLYNVVNTIVQQSITTVEMWVAYGGSTETEVIDIVENIFEHNDIIEAPDGDMYFEPEFDEPDMEMSYETVEIG